MGKEKLLPGFVFLSFLNLNHLSIRIIINICMRYKVHSFNKCVKVGCLFGSSRFCAVPCFLCQNLIFLRQYHFSVFVPSYAVSVCHLWVARTCCTIKEGGGMWGWARKEIILRGWYQNYFGTLILPILRSNLTPSLDPCPERYLGDELRGSCGNTILRPRLWSDR